MPLDLTNTPNTADTEGHGRVVAILDESGDEYLDAGKPVTMRVIGTYSKAFKKAQRKLQERNSRRSGKPTDEQREADTRALWAVCVLEWELVIGATPADPATIFALKPHIMDQVADEAGNHAAFFSDSSTSSRTS